MKPSAPGLGGKLSRHARLTGPPAAARGPARSARQPRRLDGRRRSSATRLPNPNARTAGRRPARCRPTKADECRPDRRRDALAGSGKSTTRSATADSERVQSFALDRIAACATAAPRGKRFEQPDDAFDRAIQRNGAERRRGRGVARERDMDMRATDRPQPDVRRERIEMQGPAAVDHDRHLCRQASGEGRRGERLPRFGCERIGVEPAHAGPGRTADRSPPECRRWRRCRAMPRRRQARAPTRRSGRGSGCCRAR